MMSKVEEIIRDISAAEILPRYLKLTDNDITLKSPNDPVTIADKITELSLSGHLKAEFPGSVVVGEEGFAADPTILSLLNGDQDVWIIDPIDGTRNFISGKAEFAVMVALVRQNQTIASWIHHPLTGDTLMAERGGGVWLRGKRMHLAGHEGGREPLAVLGSRLKKNLAQPEMALISKYLPKVTSGSASSFDYASLFTGEVLFAESSTPRATYLIYKQTKIWDHLPGLLMVTESGGYAADFNDLPYNWKNTMRGLIVAPDHKSWQALLSGLRPALSALKFD